MNKKATSPAECPDCGKTVTNKALFSHRWKWCIRWQGKMTPRDASKQFFGAYFDGQDLIPQFRCSVCGRYYDRKGNLMRHLTAYHPETVIDTNQQ